MTDGVLSTNSTAEFVDNTKRPTPFIAADGHAEAQCISESSHDSCSKLVLSKDVDNSKHRLRLRKSTVKTNQNHLTGPALAAHSTQNRVQGRCVDFQEPQQRYSTDIPQSLHQGSRQ